MPCPGFEGIPAIRLHAVCLTKPGENQKYRRDVLRYYLALIYQVAGTRPSRIIPDSRELEKPAKSNRKLAKRIQVLVVIVGY